MKTRTIYLLLLVLIVPLLAGCQIGAQTSGKQTGQSPKPTATRSARVTGSDNVPLAVSNQPTSGAQARATAVTQVGSAPVQSQNTIPDVVRTVKGGVVQVIVQGPQGTGTGSGFVINDQSHIITNNHVIRGATKITVVLSDNRVAKATLVGADPETDLAVLQIPTRNLPVLPLGNVDELQVGDTVIAMGSALGLPGGPTVTTGVVSAKGRAETEPGEDPSTQGPRLYDLIQTDTAINPGNSGGPLLNLRGQVVGINTLGQRSTASGVPVQGINFAISINTARAVSQEIIRTGKVTYPYIGVYSQFLYPQQAVTEGLPDIPGQLISSSPGTPGIIPGTPADKAGLRAGDIITAINGQKITDESTFVRLLRSYKPGDKITLTIRRGSQTKEVPITLARRPASNSTP